MSYPLRRSCALVTALGLLAVSAVGCAESRRVGDEDRQGAAQTTPGELGLGGAASGAPIAAGDLPRAEIEEQIKIDNFTFDPPTLTIVVGTKVTWVNHDDVPHTATSSAKPRAFASGTLDTDDKFSHLFTATGTYEYFCAVHPKMQGQIIVK